MKGVINVMLRRLRKVVSLIIACLVGVSIFSIIGFSAEKIKLRVAVDFPEWQIETRKYAMEKKYNWSKKFPNVEIGWEIIPTDYTQKLLTEIATGNPPDVFIVNEGNYLDMISRGTILDLSPFIREDRAKGDTRIIDYQARIAPKHYQALYVNGKIYGLTWFGTPGNLALIANDNRFKEVGLSFPKGSWTWQQYLEACKKLTEDLNGDGIPDRYGLILETWIGRFWPYFWQAGGEMWNRERTKTLINSPEAIEAFQFIQDLVYKYRIAQISGGLFDAEAKLANGVAGMFWTGTWSLGRLEASGMEWSAHRLPHYRKYADVGYAALFSISSKTKYPRESWEVVKHFAGPEEFWARQIDQLGKGTSYDSKVLSTDLIAYTASMKAPKSWRERPIWSQELKITRSLYEFLVPQWDKIQEKVLNPLFELLLLNKISAKDMCNDAEKKINELLLEK